MAKTDITAERLREAFHYDPETGIFTWIEKRSGVRRFKTAGSIGSNGYIYIEFLKKQRLAHRLAWLYVHGVWPTEIDHINHNTADCRISNLREVTSSINKQNKIKCQSNNKSCGILGVTFNKSRGKWMWQLTVDGLRRSGSGFKTPEDASTAYIAAKRIYHAGNTL
jgi:hypothetical protein